MRLATVKLRHKRKPKKVIKVNARDYAQDLGKGRYRNYELVSEQHNMTDETKIEVPEQESKDAYIDSVVSVGDGEKAAPSTTRSEGASDTLGTKRRPGRPRKVPTDDSDKL